MVRKVKFKTSFTPLSSAGDPANGIHYNASASYTSRYHSSGGGLNIEAPNIEVTVPDNWGGNTLSPVQQQQDSNNKIGYFSPLGSPITMNIIIKAHGNIDNYYKLRDKFVRTWGTGLFTVNIITGNYHGGNQCIDGYFSSIDFDEFRSSNDVSGTAVFTPTTPWYFDYADGNESLPFGDCPVLGGKPTIDSEGYAMINTNFAEFRRIYPVKDEGVAASGIKIISANYDDPLHTDTTLILPEDIFHDGIATSCSLFGSYITTYDDNGAAIDQFDILPQGLLAIGLNPKTKVRRFHYSETYAAKDAFPDHEFGPVVDDSWG